MPDTKNDVKQQDDESEEKTIKIEPLTDLTGTGSINIDIIDE